MSSIRMALSTKIIRSCEVCVKIIGCFPGQHNSHCSCIQCRRNRGILPTFVTAGINVKCGGDVSGFTGLNGIPASAHAAK